MTAPVPPLPGWSWSNLSTQEAEDLDADLDRWVADYNGQLAIRMEHIIPACWRQHPALVQELPVQFFAWGYLHRDPSAGIIDVLGYYTRSLPSFRDRVADLLAPDPSGCRSGHHTDRGSVLHRAIERAATDTEARGPDIIDVLTGTAFGH